MRFDSAHRFTHKTGFIMEKVIRLSNGLYVKTYVSKPNDVYEVIKGSANAFKSEEDAVEFAKSCSIEGYSIENHLDLGDRVWTGVGLGLDMWRADMISEQDGVLLSLNGEELLVPFALFSNKMLTWSSGAVI